MTCHKSNRLESRPRAVESLWFSFEAVAIRAGRLRGGNSFRRPENRVSQALSPVTQQLTVLEGVIAQDCKSSKKYRIGRTPHRGKKEHSRAIGNLSKRSPTHGPAKGPNRNGTARSPPESLSGRFAASQCSQPRLDNLFSIEPKLHVPLEHTNFECRTATRGAEVSSIYPGVPAPRRRLRVP